MSKYSQLTQPQRYTIQDLFNLEKTQTYIAKELGVNRSTVCRELHRNKNSQRLYKAKGAQSTAVERRLTANEGHQKIKGELKEIVIEKLGIGWSPEQISGRLKLEDSIHAISHESIYTWIYNKEPTYKLKLRRQGRRQRRGNDKKKRKWVGKEARKLIDERPEVCDDRNELGHWERDLIEGVKSHSSLLVMVDRASRYTIINKVSSHHADHVNKKTYDGLNESKHPVFSMTNDNGIEFGKWKGLEDTINAPVYYCHPYSSWERGSVENTNGLIRGYFPKKTNFDKIPKENVKAVQNNINFRPRKIHNYLTAHEFHFDENQGLIESINCNKKKMNQRIEVDL